jgi:dephospho-CoA kinase
MQKIIFLVGFPGCGKGTVAKFAHGYRKFAFGDIFREECKRRYGKINPVLMEKTVKWFHTGNRPRLLSKRMWARVKPHKKVIIDGCRNKLQFQEFVRLSKVKPIVVYVYSPRSFRYKLMASRGRSDFSGYKYLIEREQRELKQGLAWMLTQVNYRVSNRSTKAQLRTRALKLFRKIEKDF